MKVVIAPQEYKGTLTAPEAAAAIAAGVRAALPEAEIDQVPLADGGSGTVDALVSATGGKLGTASVTGPMGESVSADWGYLPDGTAVIEMAAAAGLLLVPESRRDPRLATTYGVGELLLAAVDAGCNRVIVGMGGSATNDGGAGVAQALGARLLDEAGRDLEHGGAALARLRHIDTSGIDARLSSLPVIAATDVQNPLTGPEGASMIYGPQKGASPKVAEELDAALVNYAEVIRRDIGVDVANIPGAGSAGGLGAGLVAFLGAEIRSGAAIVTEAVGLDERLKGADLLITGEGGLDGQTAYGKAVAGALAAASAAGVPAIVVPGSTGPGWEDAAGGAAIVETAPGEQGDAAQALVSATERAVRRWLSAR